LDVNDLVVAALCGDREALEEILGRFRKPALGPIDINAVHSTLGYSALHAAADFGHVPAARYLVQRGGDVKALCTQHGRTPLHYAAFSKRAAMCRVLIEELGASRKAVDWAHNRPCDLVDVATQADRQLRDVLMDPPDRPPVPVLRDASAFGLELEWVSSRLSRYSAEATAWEVRWRPYHVPPPKKRQTPSHRHRKRRASMSAEGNTQEWSSIVLPLDTLSYAITGLRPATPYEVAVLAHSRVGPGLPSRSTSYRTTNWVPDAPSAPRLVRCSTSSLTLCVEEPPSSNGHPLLGWEVEYCPVAFVQQARTRTDDEEGEEEEAVKELRQGWSSIVIEEPATTFTIRAYENASYYVRLRARNELGLGEASPEAGPFKATHAIRLLEGTCTTLHLAWAAHPYRPVWGFELQQRGWEGSGGWLGDSDEGFTTLRHDIREPSYIVRGLQPARSVEFRVRCNYNGVWEAWADGMRSGPLRTLSAPPDPPSVPLFSAATMVEDSVTLAWTSGLDNGATILQHEVQGSRKPGAW
jgi:hypothetical protein